MSSVVPDPGPLRSARLSPELSPTPARVVSAVEDLTVEEVLSTEGFFAMAPEWRELLENSDSDCLFLTWEWLYTWWKCLAESRKLRILTVRRGDDLLGIAPFALLAADPARLLPFRAIEFLGVGAVGSDYLDLIIKKGEEDAVCTVIAEHIKAWPLMLDMRRVARGGANVERLVEALVARDWSSMSSDDDICLYVPLSGSSWDEYFGGLNREFRRSLRRGRRNAQSTYAVRCVSVGRENDRSAALRDFIDLHNKRWCGRDGSQALPDASIIQFHEQWSRLALNRGRLRLSTLLFDDTPVAGIYGFSYGGRLYFYLSGFDPSFATYGVGRMCLEESLREAFEEGLEEYDFLHGDEKYKYHWAHDFRALGRYRLFPPGFRGHASRWFHNAREVGKSLLTSRGHGSSKREAGGGNRPASSIRAQE